MDETRVVARGPDGAGGVVSLLALDAPTPQVGDWLVVHSGYALERLSEGEAAALADELGEAGYGMTETRERLGEERQP